jgi:hypothetical protein
VERRLKEHGVDYESSQTAGFPRRSYARARRGIGGSCGATKDPRSCALPSNKPASSK